MNTKVSLKWAISMAIIISSITVCIFGLNYQKKHSTKEKVANAERTFNDETLKLEKNQKQIEDYYLDQTHEFIKNDIDSAGLDRILNSVSIVKTTPEDFGLEKSDFSDNSLRKSEKLTLLKTANVEKLTDVTIKIKTQKEIAALFEQSPVNWQVDEGNNVIKENLSMKTIEQIRPLIAKKQGVWRVSMDRFLADAQAQVSQYETIKKTIDDQMDGEKVASNATLETYHSLTEQVQLIKNEQLRTKLIEKLNNIYTLLGPQEVYNSLVTSPDEVTNEGVLHPE